MVLTEVDDQMDALLLADFLALAMFAAMAFSVYVICFMVWHHVHIKQQSSKMLLVHGILELCGLFFLFLGFYADLRLNMLFFIGFDFLIAAWICFDYLYRNFFYDGFKYPSVMSKTFLLFLFFWGFTHFVIAYYDWSGNENLRFAIPGQIFLGVVLISYIFHHDMVQFKGLRDHTAMELDHVERSEKWKVSLVSKQYKFLYLQFPVYIFGYVMIAFGLVNVVVEGLSLLATILFCTGIMACTIGKGCQLMGFFHPVPQWKEALNDG